MKSYLPACRPAMIVVNVSGTSSSLTCHACASFASSAGTSEYQLPLAVRSVSGGSTAMPTRITPDCLILARTSSAAATPACRCAGCCTRADADPSTTRHNAAQPATSATRRLEGLLTSHLQVHV